MRCCCGCRPRGRRVVMQPASSLVLVLVQILTSVLLMMMTVLSGSPPASVLGGVQVVVAVASAQQRLSSTTAFSSRTLMRSRSRSRNAMSLFSTSSHGSGSSRTSNNRKSQGWALLFQHPQPTARGQRMLFATTRRPYNRHFGLMLTTTTSSNHNHNDNNSNKPFLEDIKWQPKTSIHDNDYNCHDDDDDTIYALSTGGSGSSAGATATAVAVIRISGPSAPRLLQSMSSPSLRNTLPNPRVATLRKLFHPQTQQPLDQALVLYFAAPNSFTGQDLVELHCHGSRAVLEGVLQCLAEQTPPQLGRGGGGPDSSAVVRLAEPGEFTQRAYARGKLDLVQVEALADLLAADTAVQRQQALRQLDGRATEQYAVWRDQLVAGLAHAEAVIDFGDDELNDNDGEPNNDIDNNDEQQQQQQQQFHVWGGVVERMRTLRTSMQKQLADQHRGELVRDGVPIAILGAPNAGKSSLFNILAARDAAIVSDTAGTTRDVLEVALNLGGVKCRLQDTAGLRRASEADGVEREGMKRALRAAAEAHLVVALVDATDCGLGLRVLDNFLDNDETTVADRDVAPENSNNNNGNDPKRVVLVWNKVDLLPGSTIDDTLQEDESQLLSSIRERVGASFEISCQSQEGIDAFLEDLTQRVVKRVNGGSKDEDGDSGSTSNNNNNEGALITRARHRQHVQAAVEALERFDGLSLQGIMSADMAAEELRLAASELGRITGAVDVEDVLDKLFSDFCIGK